MSEPPRPLQNRIDPFGRLIAVPARGAWMGNRGRLHDDHRRIVRRGWTTHAWITCLLAFKARRRVVMAPGRYTELFFLDEVTAFAAGHRPCGECRRVAYLAFKRAWLAANGDCGISPGSTIAAVDAVIHRERSSRPPWSTAPGPAAMPGDLPDGAMVSEGAEAYLIWRGRLHRWTPWGYDRDRQAERDVAMRLITPWSVVRAFAAGYRPAVHPTVERQ